MATSSASAGSDRGAWPRSSRTTGASVRPSSAKRGGRVPRSSVALTALGAVPATTSATGTAPSSRTSSEARRSSRRVRATRARAARRGRPHDALGIRRAGTGGAVAAAAVGADQPGAQTRSATLPGRSGLHLADRLAEAGLVGASGERPGHPAGARWRRSRPRRWCAATGASGAITSDRHKTGTSMPGSDQVRALRGELRATHDDLAPVALGGEVWADSRSAVSVQQFRRAQFVAVGVLHIQRDRVERRACDLGPGQPRLPRPRGTGRTYPRRLSPRTRAEVVGGSSQASKTDSGRSGAARAEDRRPRIRDDGGLPAPGTAVASCAPADKHADSPASTRARRSGRETRHQGMRWSGSKIACQRSLPRHPRRVGAVGPQIIRRPSPPGQM